jgi:hypothetical protein
MREAIMSTLNHVVGAGDARSGTAPDLPGRFDGAAIWAGLTPDQQAEIGSIAMELVAAWWLQEQSCDPETGCDVLMRAGDAADSLLISQLQEVFVETIPRCDLNDADGRPRIPSRLGAVCRQCGCTDYEACPEGCGWAEADLCTACADVFNPHGSGPVPVAERAAIDTDVDPARDT